MKMEFNGCKSYEQEALIGELNQGFQLATQLKAQMSAEIHAGETQGMLAQRICSCFEKALLILKWGNMSMEQSHHHVVPSSSTMMPESPLSIIGRPKSEEFNPGCHAQQDSKKSYCSKKNMPTWTEQVKTSSENAVEGAPNDWYSWRKYGQKEILGAIYPRSYYRCTYRNIQGCRATKQVQRNDEDPTVFDITYKGIHTCTISRPRSKSAQNLDTQETGFLFPAATGGSTYENHTLITASMLHENQPLHSLTPSYIPSPATSESTYFSMSPGNSPTKASK